MKIEVQASFDNLPKYSDIRLTYKDRKWYGRQHFNTYCVNDGKWVKQFEDGETDDSYDIFDSLDEFKAALKLLN